jgi:uncharacterized protein YuzE
MAKGQADGLADQGQWEVAGGIVVDYDEAGRIGGVEVFERQSARQARRRSRNLLSRSVTIRRGHGSSRLCARCEARDGADVQEVFGHGAEVYVEADKAKQA